MQEIGNGFIVMFWTSDVILVENLLIKKKDQAPSEHTSFIQVHFFMNLKCESKLGN